jgi:hypothetical protein
VISLIKSVPNFSDWTDFQAADLGNLLIEAFFFVGDGLAFNMDWAAREGKWGTATQLRSLLRLSKMIAYKPRGASASTATVTITVTGLQDDVTYPAGSVINTKTNPPVSFQTLTDLVLTVAVPAGEVDVEHSQNCSESFEATVEANQTYTLKSSPYLSGSISVSTAAGAFTSVDNFLASRASDRHFLLDRDANGVAKLTFGDGTVGDLPTGTVALAYKTGGGADGAVEAGAICDPQGTFYDDSGNRVTITATNAERAVGAAEPETVASIKGHAPATICEGNRTVSREDYETTARKAAGVGRALFLTRLEDPAVDYNAGMLWVVPTGLGFLTSPLRSAITAQFLKYPYSPSFVFDIMDPWYLDISITTRVYFSGSAKPARVKTAILAALANWFALAITAADGTARDNPNSNFGYYIQDANGSPVGSLALSDLFNVVRDIEGVRKVGGNPEDFQLSSELTTTGGSTVVQAAGYHDLNITPRQFPRLGTVTIVNGDTGNTV